jgi:hypothetical protein
MKLSVIRCSVANSREAQLRYLRPQAELGNENNFIRVIGVIGVIRGSVLRSVFVFRVFRGYLLHHCSTEDNHEIHETHEMCEK